MAPLAENRRGIIRLTIRNPNGLATQADVVVDSGYDRFLSLTPAIITTLDIFGAAAPAPS